jgi:DNA-binding NarL/FixJ family response regulator
LTGKISLTKAHLSCLPRKGFLMSEATAAILERPGPISPVEDGGRIAVASHLRVVTGPEPELPFGVTTDEAAVLTTISEGHTGLQVARQLEIDKSQVDTLRGEAMEKLGTRSIAQATHRAIQARIIPVEVVPDAETIAELHPADAWVLRLYARGISNHRIAEGQKQPVRTLEVYHDRLLRRLGAWSRPHAIRRGHELDLLS